jgi:L-ascorbate metabolism protein UlaG (beta-lactamase superfamily)
METFGRMEITWYGHSCFRIVERSVASIVTDPYDEKIGYTPLRLKADIITVSHDAPGHNAVDGAKGTEHVLTRPGEYEIGGVFITGVAMYDTTAENLHGPNVVYLFDFDGLMVCHLGDLNAVPTQSEIEALGPIDVLLIPVGGGGALNSSQAVEVISLIEPAIVIPMHYKTPPTRLNLDPLDKFLKEMGIGTVDTLDSLKVSASSADEETHVVVLGYEH